MPVRGPKLFVVLRAAARRERQRLGEVGERVHLEVVAQADVERDARRQRDVVLDPAGVGVPRRPGVVVAEALRPGGGQPRQRPKIPRGRVVESGNRLAILAGTAPFCAASVPLSPAPNPIVRPFVVEVLEAELHRVAAGHPRRDRRGHCRSPGCSRRRDAPPPTVRTAQVDRRAATAARRLRIDDPTRLHRLWPELFRYDRPTRTSFTRVRWEELRAARASFLLVLDLAGSGGDRRGRAARTRDSGAL